MLRPLLSIALLEPGAAQGYVRPILVGVDLALVIGVGASVLVGAWVLQQIRASGRRMWAVDVACALRARDLDELDRLAANTSRRRWIPALTDLLDELRVVLSHEDERARSAETSGAAYRERFQQGPIAEMVIDGKGHITSCNDEACWLTGRLRSGLVGEDARALVRDDPVATAQFQWLLDGFGARAEYVEVKRIVSEQADGGLVLVIHQTVEHGEGREDELVWALLDLNGVGQPASSSAGGGRSPHSIERLAAGVARDFNDRLTTILWNSSILGDRIESNHAARRNLAEISQAVDEARSLSKRLLAFGRPDSNRVEVVQPDASVRDARARLAKLVGNDVRVELRLDAEGVWVRGADKQIEEILEHLVQNSAQAMNMRGRVVIETGVVEHEARGIRAPVRAQVRLRVADDGPGMPATTRRRAFDPFFTTKASGGVGLGLPVVRHLVEQNGGTIRLTRSDAGGLCVEMCFAVQQPESVESQPDAPESVEPVTERDVNAEDQRTICVVDDDGPVRRVVASALRMNGYRALEAASGAEAIEFVVLNEERVDLLIVDVHMPEMDGRELHERLRATHPDLRVLYMSGFIDREAFLNEHPRGDGFIQKPFTQDELVNRVAHAFPGFQSVSKRRVLVVNEDAATREALMLLLDALQIESILVDDGDEALRALESLHVDAVISDVAEALDGASACAAIHARHPDLKLIALAHEDQVTADEGAIATLSSPVDSHDLQAALTQAFGEVRR